MLVMGDLQLAGSGGGGGASSGSAAAGVCSLVIRNMSAPPDTSGKLAAARDTHTATLLQNGLVLVVGGCSGTSALARAELFDPATDTFRTTGSLVTARGYQSATLLPKCCVLFTVGSYFSAVLASADIY